MFYTKVFEHEVFENVMQCIKSGGAVSDEYYMQQALREAHKALDAGEVPIGAVVMMNNSIIGRGHNQVETLRDATAYAEMLAVTAAFNHLGAKFTKVFLHKV